MEVELSAATHKWTQPIGLFINNEWVASSGGKAIPTFNPTTEEEICAPHAATKEDVDKAVQAARAAFKDKSWKELNGEGRGKLLNKLADLVEANADIVTAIDTLNVGKPFHLFKSFDTRGSIDMLRYCAGWADKMHGESIDLGPNKMAYTIKTPHGVVGAIVPWNFNNMQMAVKIGPALACGNTIVIKVSEIAPLVGLYWAKLVRQAGFPPGVINIISGEGPEAGAALASHMDVDKIAFTGTVVSKRSVAPHFKFVCVTPLKLIALNTHTNYKNHL
ncbi:Aldehyde/histidinol dehydrogenase [Xylariomycetidae sp. FL0641]|nr:Aldehyde/histidinol dehydrogenase [Xylariomycetidae sp. FL0641]